MELYKKYRPQNFNRVVGQSEAVTVLKQWIEDNNLPRSILFTGPSGCGKTTLGRILVKELGCSGTDFRELNAADVRGIDKVREIRSQMSAAALYGNCRIWLLDECHKWTNDSQHAMLKLLEDTPKHVWFILCTTNPEKLLKTIKTRCSEIHLKSIPDNLIDKLIKNVCIAEKNKIHQKVIDKIVANSDGSARKALVHLNTVIRLSTPTQMLEAIQSSTVEIQAIKIAQQLFKPKGWPAMAVLLRECQDEESEQLRWMVLGYAKTIILKNPKMSGRAYLVIDAFRDNFYDSKHAGLAAACYEVLAEK